MCPSSNSYLFLGFPFQVSNSGMRKSDGLSLGQVLISGTVSCGLKGKFIYHKHDYWRPNLYMERKPERKNYSDVDTSIHLPQNNSVK